MSTIKSLVAAVGLVAVSVLYIGDFEMDVRSAAAFFERFIAPVGIILLPSVLSPERDRRILEVVRVKPLSYPLVLLSRVLLAAISIFAVIGMILLIMVISRSSFPVRALYFGAAASIACLGAIGLFVASLSGNVIAGYLVALMWFFTDMMAVPKDSALSLSLLIGDIPKPVGNRCAVAVALICCALVIQLGAERKMNVPSFVAHKLAHRRCS
ncbi:MAG: hypothetical protein LBQ21_05560 [Clostridiales Family XIII bacterium]|nr:hypothetical protein [Clostridiales Family XIII bacterium]